MTPACRVLLRVRVRGQSRLETAASAFCLVEVQNSGVNRLRSAMAPSDDEEPAEDAPAVGDTAGAEDAPAEDAGAEKAKGEKAAAAAKSDKCGCTLGYASH